MLPSFMSQPFTRKRYPTIVDHGTEVRNYSTTPEFGTFYGSIQPGTGTIDTLNRNGAEVVFTIFAQPAADVVHDDLVTLADGTYFVNGEPERWTTGIMDHTVVRLSRWKG